jgi:quinol monooxygenase YgiN
MPSVVANLKLKEDQLENALTFLRELAESTLANEPGTLAYVIHQRRDDPLSIVVYEKYASDEAFAEHGKNLGSKAGEFMALMDGPPEVILIEEI